MIEVTKEVTEKVKQHERNDDSLNYWKRRLENQKNWNEQKPQGTRKRRRRRRAGIHEGDDGRGLDAGKITEK